MRSELVIIGTIFQLILLLLPCNSLSHGFVGKRFFPSTLAIDDPFVSDELSVIVAQTKEPGEEDGSPFLSTGFSGEYSKRITPELAVSIGAEFIHLDPDSGKKQNGFNNFEVGVKYQFLTNAVHEAVLSFGVGIELGGTGSKRIGAESFSTISPAVLFGKGFGDLPEMFKYLRPLALTGLVGLNFPTRSKDVNVLNGQPEINPHPVTLTWGGTIQYNFQYLQSFIKNIGLRAPFDRMIPIVEVPFETCLNRECGGETRGSVNPGLIWFGRYFQLGIEAIIPINSRTGKHVGTLGMVHVFIDDLLPNSLGRPLFP